MSPLPVRNKRKSAVSPKATGAAETKKSKTIEKPKKQSSPNSTKKNLPRSPSTPASLDSVSLNSAGIAYTSTQLDDPADTPQSQEDLFTSATSDPDTQESRDLTFLTPTPPSFNSIMDSDNNDSDVPASASPPPTSVDVGVTLGGYDSSASANGGNEFPVVRYSDQPSPPMRKQLKGFADILDDRLQFVASKSDITQVLQKVDKNSANIDTLRRDVVKLRSDLEDEERIKNVVSRFWRDKGDKTIQTNPSFATGASCIAQDTARRNKYNISRRTLRIWPIMGSNEDDYRSGVVDFFKNGLLLTESELQSAPIEKIERVRLPSASHIHNELRVIFRDPSGRDSISSKGKLLASYHDSNGRPLAGFRMDIPEYLASDHKLLNDYGYRMKRVHGKETRKFVKFDESSFSLVLELKLPGDHTWLRITPQLARELKKEYEQEDIQRLRGKLVARPRAESSPAPQTSANWVPLGNRPPSLRADSLRNLYPNKGIPSPSAASSSSALPHHASSVLAPPTLQVQVQHDATTTDRQTWRPSKDPR